MKKLILLLTVFFTCLGVKAQEATTDYIYSSDGFVVKEGVISVGENNGSPSIYKSRGLYSKDGKVLVAALYAWVQWGEDSDTHVANVFNIIDGCETIASGAFQHFTNLIVFIPSSVRSIAPDAIISRSTYSGQTLTNRYGGIRDGVIEVGGSGAVNAPAADPNATEVARYNIQGVRLSEPTDGVNIVQMSDGTAQKVLVK